MNVRESYSRALEQGTMSVSIPPVVALSSTVQGGPYGR